MVLLANARSVGVQGDGQTYRYPIALRPASSGDVMTADWSRLEWSLVVRILNQTTNQVPQISRIVLDYTSKSPAMVEWE